MNGKQNILKETYLLWLFQVDPTDPGAGNAIFKGRLLAELNSIKY